MLMYYVSYFREQQREAEESRRDRQTDGKCNCQVMRSKEYFVLFPKDMVTGSSMAEICALVDNVNITTWCVLVCCCSDVEETYF